MPEIDAELTDKIASVFQDDTLRSDYEGEQGDAQQQGQGADDADQQDVGTQQQQQVPQRGRANADGSQDPTQQQDRQSPRQQDRAPSQQRGAKPQSPQQQKGRVGESGDIVDARGNVVAARGRERGYYEGWQRAEYAARQYRQERDNAAQQLRAYQDAFKSYEATGLKPADMPTAFAMVAKFKQDPVATLRELLTQVAASGIDVSSITGGGGGAMDARAIKSIVDEALAPFRKEYETRQQHDQDMVEAKREYENFIATYPHARANIEVLDRMMQQNPGVPMENMWLRIESWAYQRGLDPHSPLRPQIEGQQQNNSGVADTRNGGRGLPNGRFANGGATVQRGDQTQGFSPNASNKDIVRAAMREAGINV